MNPTIFTQTSTSSGFDASIRQLASMTSAVDEVSQRSKATSSVVSRLLRISVHTATKLGVKVAGVATEVNSQR